MGGVSRPPDYYLVGVDKIIVWAYETSDTESINEETQPGHPHRTPKIDFEALNRSVADQLRAALPEDMKQKIQVETIFESPLHSGQPNKDENALILSFPLGFHKTQLGDRPLRVGAVYTMVERLPPADLRRSRVYGVHPSAFAPSPFLVDGDEAAINQAILQATQRCVNSVVEWFKLMPLQMPDNAKGKR